MPKLPVPNRVATRSEKKPRMFATKGAAIAYEKPTPAADLLIGARAIGEFLFPDVDPEKRRRRVYHAVETMKGDQRPPLFNIGASICGRRSTLLAWLDAKERRA